MPFTNPPMTDESFSHYCARCLAAATPRHTQCSSCRTPFLGAGRFDRVYGPAPARGTLDLTAWLGSGKPINNALGSPN